MTKIFLRILKNPSSREATLKRLTVTLLCVSSIVRFPTNNVKNSENILKSEINYGDTVGVGTRITRVVRDNTRENTYPNRYVDGYTLAFEVNAKHKQTEQCHKNDKGNDIER